MRARASPKGQIFAMKNANGAAILHFMAVRVCVCVCAQAQVNLVTMCVQSLSSSWSSASANWRFLLVGPNRSRSQRARPGSANTTHILPPGHHCSLEYQSPGTTTMPVDEASSRDSSAEAENSSESRVSIALPPPRWLSLRSISATLGS